MKNIIITKKIWNLKNFNNINNHFFVFKKINLKKINSINPKIIFFIHWSKIVPANLFEKYTCVQFHSSDLPRFRGGSPIQNQIISGIKKTKLTAFKMTQKIDSGDIYLKKKLSLEGSVENIYKNMEKTAIKMAKIISKKKIKLIPQIGKATFFKRRKPKESNINKANINSITKFYNFIRMLDAKGYPNAYLNFKKFKIKFRSVRIVNKNLYENFKIEK